MEAFASTAPEEMKIMEWGVFNLIQAYTGERKHDAEFLKQISPIQYITPSYPPVLISGGNKDFLTDTPVATICKSFEGTADSCD